MPCMEPKSDKIGGYDKYKVSNAVETLFKAQEIQQDKTFYAVVKTEVAKKVEAAAAVAVEHKVEQKIKSKLKDTYGHNPGKKSGY